MTKEKLEQMEKGWMEKMIITLERHGYVVVKKEERAQVEKFKKCKNKTKAIMEHLKEYGSITSAEAINEYNATRLSGHIFDIKPRLDKDGYKITTEVIDKHSGAVRYNLVKEVRIVSVENG